MTGVPLCHRRGLRALPGDQRGATLIEFALVTVPFLVLFMGTLDMGYQAYLRSLAFGVLEQAARRSAVGGVTEAQTIAYIKEQMAGFLPAAVAADPNSVVVTPSSYSDFGSITRGERIVGDTAPVGTYNSTDCYEDRNGNGRWDAVSTGSANAGGADDVAYYQVTVTVPRIAPIDGLIPGMPRNLVVSAKTLIRNQPYAQQTVLVRCT